MVSNETHPPQKAANELSNLSPLIVQTQSTGGREGGREGGGEGGRRGGRKESEGERGREAL